MDPDGEAVICSAGGLPSGAQFNAAQKRFSWKPSYDQAGTYFVEFIATDSGKLSDSETVQITVNNANRPPVIANVSCSPATGRVGQSVQFTASASDPDGDALSCDWDLGDGTRVSGASLQTGLSHSYGRAGNYLITLNVTDGKGESATRTVQKRIAK